MTEERKRELTELLHEAMESLEIRSVSGDWSLMCLEEYTEHLRKSWTSYSRESNKVVFRFRPKIVNQRIESRFLEFIREEFSQFIHEGKILSATFYVLGGTSDGFHLDDLLEQLLRIAIVRGVDEALLAFDRCTQGKSGSYKVIALLKGMRLKEAKEVFEGMQLVPLPDSTSELPSYLPYTLHRGMSDDYFCSKTLLVINYSINPMFHKPVLLATTSNEFNSQKERFQVEVNGGKFPGLYIEDFYEKFCQAFSLACNSPIEIAHKWEWMAADKLFNVSHGALGGIMSVGCHRWFESPAEVEEVDIEKAKSLYHILDKNSDIWTKLRIPINRWIDSKTSDTYEDQIIDLGIALESLYVPDGGGDLTYKFSVRGAWHLGQNNKHRSELRTKLAHMYGHRSTVVHGGRIDRKVKFGERRIDVIDFIRQSQDLCQQSIMKVLTDKCLPDANYWNRLVLGG